MDEQFVMLCNCMRPSTGTEMTIPLPPGITPETIVDYIGNEFDWQFIPMAMRIVPKDQLSGYFESP